MKWNIIIGSLVLGICLSTQSYGFELLDRMLGLKGCGCEAKSCETKADTKCGAEKKGCDAKKSCHRSLLGHLGCDAKKSCDNKDKKCGAEKAKCGANKHGCDSKKAGKPNNSKNSAEKKGKPVRVERSNKCGSEKAKCQAKKKSNDCSAKKDSCKHSCLLDILRGHGCDAKKDDGKCGAERKKRCGCDAAGDKAESSAEVTPATPPAPVVDPSALLPSQRRILQASFNTSR